VEAILVAPDVFRYPLRLSERARPPAAEPGFAAARPGEKTAEEGREPGRAKIPPERIPAEADTGAAGGPGPGAGGLPSEFRLTYPSDARSRCPNRHPKSRTRWSARAATGPERISIFPSTWRMRRRRETAILRVRPPPEALRSSGPAGGRAEGRCP